jgi:heme exporter protein D
MKFQFESLNEFMVMSGHGPYVWASYAITFAALIYLLIRPVVQHKAFVKQQLKMQKLSAAQDLSSES